MLLCWDQVAVGETTKIVEASGTILTSPSMEQMLYLGFAELYNNLPLFTVTSVGEKNIIK
jgi:hypothetical protein